jgi:hypothetical protein
MVAKRFRKVMNGVADARQWANELIRRESRGPGDLENAMRRLEARYGIPWRTFWALRYRAPADVFVGVYLQLKAAYESECLRQERLLKHEREITKAKMAAFETLVRSEARPSD